MTADLRAFRQGGYKNNLYFSKANGSLLLLPNLVSLLKLTKCQ